MTSAHKIRRDAARSRGDCTTCCKRPAVTGSCRCVECNAWRARAKDERADPAARHRDLCKERGDCTRCASRPAAPERTTCDECRAATAAHVVQNQRKLYKQRRAAGLCTVCEAPSRGKWACLACRLAHQQKTAQAKQRNQDERRTARLGEGVEA